MNDIVKKTHLEKNAAEFINEFCTKNEADTSMIVAGMIAIIKSNESALEKIKKQKWFERIWYTLTGKNKATVKEMQQRRDDLNRYLVMIISKLSDMVAEQSFRIAELSSAVLILDDELRSMRVSVDKIARALNDKIISLDTYSSIIIDIRNGKYSVDKPLMSLIVIMSQLDSRTLKDSKRLTQLKETMESVGFSFNSKVNAREYANQVFSLPEESIGGVYLFCQNLLERSRFLAYTCYLIENYFFLGETDRDIVKNQTDEAIDESLKYANLSSQADCVVDYMYKDLTKVMLEEIDRISIMAKEPKISAFMIGKDSRGNIDLLDVLKKEYAYFDVEFVDFKIGLNEKDKEKLQRVRSVIKDKGINCVIYCVDACGAKIDKFEIEFIKSLSREFPMLCTTVALTNCIHKSNDKELSDYIREQTGKEPVCLLAKDCEFDHNVSVVSFGVDELVDEVISLCGKSI